MVRFFKPVFVVALAVLIFVAGCVSGSSADWFKEATVFGEIFKAIENQYLYPIDLAKCRYEILKSLSASSIPPPEAKGDSGDKTPAVKETACLDRHSMFHTPEEYKEMQKIGRAHV